MAAVRLLHGPWMTAATEHSPAVPLDPDIRLQKEDRTVETVRIKTHHPRQPDVGIGINVSMQNDRASQMIEYYGEYLGHGQSKTAFELTSKDLGARFHGKVLKVAKKSTQSRRFLWKHAN
jgi:hypothetical protein